ncbi:hypothetical protein Tco_1258373 [Tanacetum coccineum]
MNVLNYFSMASGLKINIHKSKLSRIGVSKENIEFAANITVCFMFSLPFNYLGIKVGAPMSRLNSWKDITAKISSRLSKWKLKSLSIGGRYTLLKSVFTSIPIYHMSLFKVLARILKEMESIRRNFFNRMDRSEKKMIWIRWEKFLASKKNEGLAIHEDKGATSNPYSLTRTSIWLDLVREFSSLAHKGIDLNALVKRKLGNGENTLFWEDIWLGDSSFKTKFPRLFALEIYKGISVAEKMAHSSLNFSFRRLPIGGAEDTQYQDLYSYTYEVLLPKMSDRWVWSLSASGDFSVSSTRSYIDDVSLPKSDVPTR